MIFPNALKYFFGLRTKFQVDLCGLKNCRADKKVSINTHTDAHFFYEEIINFLALIDAQAPPSSSANDGYVIGLSLAQGHTQPNPMASWMDGTPFNYANFVFNEPANSGGSDNCVATYASTNTFFGGAFAGLWNDINCSTDIMGGFVCKANAMQTCA